MWQPFIGPNPQLPQRTVVLDHSCPSQQLSSGANARGISSSCAPPPQITASIVYSCPSLQLSSRRDDDDLCCLSSQAQDQAPGKAGNCSSPLLLRKGSLGCHSPLFPPRQAAVATTADSRPSPQPIPMTAVPSYCCPSPQLAQRSITRHFIRDILGTSSVIKGSNQ
jgi:hypothetical protein